MTDPIELSNQQIHDGSAALHSLLSPLGRAVAFPPDIPAQAADAKGKAYNATIGQITDGHNGAVRMPAMFQPFEGMAAKDIDPAFLYSPVEGIGEVRDRWRQWQRRHQPETLLSSRPVVTVGLTHGLSLIADLFGGAGRPVAIPAPFWGNYRQTFAVRTGAIVSTAPSFIDGRYNCDAIAQALAAPELSAVAANAPAIALLNLPSNPGGYSLTTAERQQVRESLVRVAQQRPLLVICDDAYAGLVYEREIPRTSMFWDLNGAHPNLIPVKVDGATKEMAFFGGRVGFLTFPFDPASVIAGALESKLKCLTRSTVGSPVSTSQMVLAQAMREHGIEEEVESVRRLLERRYRVLTAELQRVDRSLLTPLPFNSGCFALLEIQESLGVSSEQVRQHLLRDEDTGIVSIAPRYIRIAFCSVDEKAIPELVKRIERAVGACRSK